MITSTLINPTAQFAVETNYTALLNCYCREFTNWSRYMGVPKYDEALANHFNKTGYDLHVRIDFSTIGCEVFVPLKYFSESGRHLFHFPVVKRNVVSDKIIEIDPYDFMNLTIEYAQTIHANIDATIALKRLANSIENLEKYLQFHQENNKSVNDPVMSFIEAEQSLILGHALHPMPKSKQGFNDSDLLKYSPETEGEFQLHYFFIDSENIIEKNADGASITQELKEHLLKYTTSEDLNVLHLLNQYPTFSVVPMHPWEANYLLQQPDVKQMMQEGKLFSIGEFGEFFTPTSSVRTVYNEDCNWMFKFSLHVKITNSERINLYPELHRGYDISRLLKTDWGKNLQKDFPEIDFIVDPAFIAVSYNEKIINGFNISIRRNPFKGENKNKNVTLLAALCQDGILGKPSRLLNIINETAQKFNKTKEEVAEDWFKQYLHICVRPIVGIFNKYGLACEFHQQNVMVELDKNGFPAKIYFRDNQGFFFREGRKDMILEAVPGISEISQSIANESLIPPKYTYYLVTNNIMGVVNAFGCNGLADEKKLIDLVYKEFKSVEGSDETGLVDYIINSRSWYTKSNLVTSLQNINEADESMGYPAVFQESPNPLNKYFFCENLIKPQTKDVLYSCYFPKEEITISIRSFDIDRDLEIVHEWFNREHAKPIWKMDGPIKNLELWYRTILPSDETHSFIGEVNGVPNFSLEPYWPMRDLVGEYYDALATDYGSHLFIAPAEKEKKFTFQSFQVGLNWIFAQAVVGKCIGEAAVEAIAMDKLIGRFGFKKQEIIEMPHKTAHLTFCTRESYWEKFPESKNAEIDGIILND
ncbi:GNAT family N-acetyltransferase [Flavobacterium psychrophilum]|uniref:GNAT family N-acetyltransferase n=1 Tax=Flavobacterium psychrophilum TaxID=96345 RepID=A0A7U2NDM0_FLAPS|nr:GNAT family N-acetyltransferase [Flavobacterium psychrophilum]ELY2016414.1 GNAT family N-acetyltransferase [Flavobacterium psychrophilum]MBF2090991.1 GNAT family N-acetyltransferase [Flavobacterium psychrophilum]OAE90017.1 IucA/IucC family protein [Flavobacterium psychrophilum]QRE03060.1 GNAT family N-acetyltransferase [Flavobacterium psychrophilum]